MVISTLNIHVTKESHRHTYEPIPTGEYVLITVTDHGVGIPKEALQHIFEPFYTRKSMGKSGSGLGMTIIWATVKDHNGYIDIKSSEGKGTTINIYLPATNNQSDTRPKHIALNDFLGTESILVVDDVAEQLEFAGNMLRQLGYTVRTASSGEQAIAMLKAEPADLLILDMIMQDGMDGLETFKKIIHFQPQQKAIIASGFSESERVGELQALGAGSYLAKPYTMEGLAIAVREELNRKARHTI